MDAKLKAQWLTALRSGEYKQGTDRLRTETDEGSEFCCLGVLCDILDSKGWDDLGYWGSKEGHSSGHLIPQGIAAGLLGVNQWGDANQDGNIGVEGRNRVSINLSGLNDSGMPFKQVADVIEWAF